MITVKGYRRTFSINCLSGNEPDPISELELTGLFDENTPPVITEFEVDILPSSSIMARQVLSYTLDDSYDRPFVVGVDTSSAIISSRVEETNSFENFLFTGSVTPFSDINTGGLYSINLIDSTAYGAALFAEPITENEGEIDVEVIVDTSQETTPIDYVGITENFRDFIIDVSALPS